MSRVTPFSLALATLLVCVAPARADRLALRDGTTMDGKIVVDATKQVIVVTSTKGGMAVNDKVPMEKAFAVETPDQKLSWLAAEGDLVEASRVLWTATERVRYLEWSDTAQKLGDGPAATRFLDAAEKRGAVGYPVKSRRQKIATLKGPSPTTPTVTEALAKIAADEAELQKARAALLWSRMEPRWPTLKEAVKFEYANQVLYLDPTHAPVTAWFTSLVPAEFRDRFTWKEWMPWRKVLGTAGTLRMPPPPGATAKGMTAIDKELARAAAIWKRDVVGIVRDGFVLIARPPAGPGLERAASTSSAVFAFLEDFFRTPAPRYPDADPVTIWVHADRNDLVAHLSPVEERWAAKHLRQRDGKKRENAAFFSPDEGLTKILSPDVPGSPEREAELRQDLAYFTTYHWLSVRCPRFRWAETNESTKAPCFFIETDFVGAVCRGATDPSTGAWTLRGRTGPLFDNWKALKSMNATESWRSVLDATFEDYAAVVKGIETKEEAALRRLIAYNVQTELAALWFVYGTDAKMRARFADHVTDYFLGKADAMDVRSVYGVDGGEIGRRIDEWASR